MSESAQIALNVSQLKTLPYVHKNDRCAGSTLLHTVLAHLHLMIHNVLWMAIQCPFVFSELLRLVSDFRGLRTARSEGALLNNFFIHNLHIQKSIYTSLSTLLIKRGFLCKVFTAFRMSNPHDHRSLRVFCSSKRLNHTIAMVAGVVQGMTVEFNRENDKKVEKAKRTPQIVVRNVFPMHSMVFWKKYWMSTTQRVCRVVFVSVTL